MKRILLIGIVFFIVIINFLLSSRMILSGDFFYLADQGRDYILVKDIVENNHITLIGTHSGLGGFFHGPLWLYMLVPFFLIGGGNPLAFTVAYILLAIATVLVGYFIGYTLYGRTTGIIFAFLLAVTPVLWMYVPNTIGVNAVPMVFLLLFYFLIRFLRGNLYAYIPAVFFAGVSLQFETALPLILLPVTAVVFLLQPAALRNIRLIFLSLLSLTVSLATFILFDVRHQFLMTKSLLGMFSSGIREKGYLELPERLISHLHSMEWLYASAAVQEHPLFTILLLSIILYLIYLVIRHQWLTQEKRKELAFLFLFPLVIFICFLFYPYPVWPEYLLGLTIPILLGYSLVFASLVSDRIGRVFIGAFLLVTLLFAGQKIFNEYGRNYTGNTTAGAYKNQKAVVDWVYADANGKPFGYYVYTPETYTYGMDYLFWYLGKANNYSPKSEKLPVTYVILYPPLENDKGAHAFWKKHKIRTSAPVMAKKQFRGNIIVEKLAIPAGEPAADPTYHQGLIFR